MLDQLQRLPDDSILGIMTAYRADTDPRKVDLGVGVYRDAHGETPVLACVRAAEQAVLARQTTKSYVAPSGNPGFNRAMERLVFGAEHPAITAGRVTTLQSVGGSGALRLGAELVRATGDPVLAVSTPSWANHVPLLTGAGLRLERYPYYDARTGGVDFGAMCTALEALAPGTVVLLHACCHNPTGADLKESEWQGLIPLFRRRGLLPFIDMAYQGLGRDVDADAYGIRLMAAELPELLVAVSCSKNLGLYRERTGALHVLLPTHEKAESVLTQAVRAARRLYSMPADHGAAIAAEVLESAGLRAQWLAELAGMRNRITELRDALADRLSRACPGRDFHFIAAQHGLFSFLGISVEQVRALRSEHHIYMTEDSRINIAGLRAENLDYFVRSVARVVSGG